MIVVILSWMGIFFFPADIIGSVFLPLVLDTLGRGASDYMHYIDNNDFVGSIVWLGGLWCGLCGLTSLILIAVVKRQGYMIDIARFYMLTPLLLCGVWLVLLGILLGRA